MPLDINNVPPALVALLPLAEKWGIGDDHYRDAVVDAAPRNELDALVKSIDHVDYAALFGWLAGPESYNKHPSKEYLAITCLIMAGDYARLRLERMQN